MHQQHPGLRSKSDIVLKRKTKLTSKIVESEVSENLHPSQNTFDNEDVFQNSKTYDFKKSKSTNIVEPQEKSISEIDVFNAQASGPSEKKESNRVSEMEPDFDDMFGGAKNGFDKPSQAEIDPFAADSNPVGGGFGGDPGSGEVDPFAVGGNESKRSKSGRMNSGFGAAADDRYEFDMGTQDDSVSKKSQNQQKFEHENSNRKVEGNSSNFNPETLFSDNNRTLENAQDPFNDGNEDFGDQFGNNSSKKGFGVKMDDVDVFGNSGRKDSEGFGIKITEENGNSDKFEVDDFGNQ